MFIWSAKSILTALERYQPEISELLNEYEKHIGTDDEMKARQDFYERTNSISIDFAVLEKADNVLTIKADIVWDDVGDWMWENKDIYNGLSVLPHSEHSYKQAPFEDCSKETYDVMSNTLSKVELTQIVEEEDETDLQGEIACAGGACEII